jgi:DNA helicase-2/ATP-dependent DNA helicase PcrA
MKFIADFHIHSKFSRATAKNLDLENLYISAQLKGITVVGTGDFTHPGWFAEIKEKLIPAEEGLFKLKDEIARNCDQEVPETCRGKVRFILTSEISNIYKKDSKTRKNHNLVFMSSLDAAYDFNAKLDSIGNIKSDGRPILGLDARDLLEITLETSKDSFLIPAHIWTPWFSLLGSKSGFNSLEECFEDLTPHVFAVETGLSSDPAMNWRVSGLDGLTLVSNSDAHSPSKLGREANIFDTKLSYQEIKSAMESGDPGHFLGTFEFYPEEGKYHFDGHRKCDICLEPKESIAYGGRCPVCKRPLTLGVLYRVEELADRPDNEKPESTHPYYSIIPLEEILSELLEVGPKSKRVQHNLGGLIRKLGPEFEILHNASIGNIDKAGIPLLGEAIKRMREKKVHLFPGYDGEFGKVRAFTQKEREKLSPQRPLFIMPDTCPDSKPDDSKPNDLKPPDLKLDGLKSNGLKQYAKKRLKKNQHKDSPKRSGTIGNKKPHPLSKQKTEGKKTKISILEGLNAEQEKAVKHKQGPLLIVAGPGTGKTHTLTRRVAHLIKNRGVAPETILALTFTNKAAQEMSERLKVLIEGLKTTPHVATFHALCLKILKEIDGQDVETVSKDSERKESHLQFNIIDDFYQIALVDKAIRMVEKSCGLKVSIKPKTCLDMIISAKQQILSPDDDLDAVACETGCDVKLLSLLYGTYQDLLSYQHLVDYEDLIFKVVKLIETDEKIRRKYQSRYQHLFVDEYQDLNHGQYRIVRALARNKASGDEKICVIGDPDQSIYGFRGSDVRYFKQFINDYPGTKIITLNQNYRSTGTILEASFQVINGSRDDIARNRVFSEIDGVKTINILALETEKSEAVTIGKTIEQMVGGMGHYSIDFGKVDSPIALAHTGNESRDMGFSDFAILYRTGAQGRVFADIFGQAGIPYQMVSRENAYYRKGLRELISYLKIIHGTGSYADFKNIVSLRGSGIGSKTLNIFEDWFYQNSFTLKEALFNAKRFPIPKMSKSSQLKLDEFVKNIFNLKENVEGMTVEKQLIYLKENIKPLEDAILNNSKSSDAFNNLINIAGIYGDKLTELFEMIALNKDSDTYDYEVQKVSLMTMHASKGLEFPVIFISGCEKGLIPYKKPGMVNGSQVAGCNINEERRLFYVAMTRAKENLFITHAKRRNLFGKQEEMAISPFVEDIEKKLRLHERILKTGKGKKPKKGAQIQLELF